MDQVVRFDTPENIAVEYRLAGPGTRFIAFTVDSLIIVLAILALVVIGLFAIAGLAALQQSSGVMPDDTPLYIFAAMFVVSMFAWLGYFIGCEWFMNGQTVGKRLCKIRVVTEQGFSLGVGAVIIRNLIRLPESIIVLLWVVPLITVRMQRLGDFAAGTIVVREDVPATLQIRAALAARSREDLEFVFQPNQLNPLRPIDVIAAESYLAKRHTLFPEQRIRLALRLSRGLAKRMDLPQPLTTDSQERFMADMLSCYAHRESRELG